MSKNGSDLILLVNTGTPLSPVYEAVGCQRDATIDEATASIDTSDLVIQPVNRDEGVVRKYHVKAAINMPGKVYTVSGCRV